MHRRLDRAGRPLPILANIDDLQWPGGGQQLSEFSSVDFLPVPAEFGLGRCANLTVAVRRKIRDLPAPEIQIQCHNLHPLAQRIIKPKPPAERLPNAGQKLDRLSRLYYPNYPGQHTEHSRLGAVRNRACIRWLREQAPVRWAALPVENTCLPLEPLNCAIDPGPVLQQAGIVHHVSRRKIVRSVHDHISRPHEFPRVRPHESLDVGFHAHQGIQRTEPLFRRDCLVLSDIFSAKKHLPLKV